MTLAFVLFLCSASWNTPVQAQSAPAEPANQATQEKPQETANPPAQSAPSEAKPSSPAQAPANSLPPAAKRKHHKKKVGSSNCGVRPMPTQPAAAGTNHQDASGSDPAPANAPANTSAQTSGASPAAQNCPPPKTIVRHGGAAEPSIQLEGGPPTSQAAQQRAVVNQLLEVTENNLKKARGKQLSSIQQGTLSQARAFVQQSKDAISDGDLDRARTLAWKAETLSEDLIKP